MTFIVEEKTREKFLFTKFDLNKVDASWQSCLAEALKKIDSDYLQTLYTSNTWLPGHEKIFSAFSLPVKQVKFVLFGESPYPRAESANGYAFWDQAVNEIWSDKGLSKKVNRATSLRHIIKMLLLSEQALQPGHTSQDDIAALDKTPFVKTNAELFSNFLNQGFLLLNATPVLQPNQVKKDAAAWQIFIKHILDFLAEQQQHTQLILFGNIANMIDKLIKHQGFQTLYAEHPYNVSFLQNQAVINFFKPLGLLRKHDQNLT